MINLFLKHSLECYISNLNTNTKLYDTYFNHTTLVASSPYCTYSQSNPYCTYSQSNLGVFYIAIPFFIIGFSIIVFVMRHEEKTFGDFILTILGSCVSSFCGTAFFSVGLFIILHLIPLIPIQVPLILLIILISLYEIFIGFKHIRKAFDFIGPFIMKLGLWFDGILEYKPLLNVDIRTAEEFQKQLQEPKLDSYYQLALREVDEILK